MGGDRTSLDLPRQEEELLQFMNASGKPVVAVLMNGSALSVSWAAKNLNGIIESWYAGEEGRAAIVETFSGGNNPSDRLPVTFYTGIDQLTPFENYSMQNRTYRYYNGTPLYPFGCGAQLLDVTYADVKLKPPTLKAGAPLEVSVDLSNASGPDGDDVVELYLTPPQTLGNPLRAPRAFERVHVPGGSFPTRDSQIQSARTQLRQSRGGTALSRPAHTRSPRQRPAADARCGRSRYPHH